MTQIGPKWLSFTVFTWAAWRRPFNLPDDVNGLRRGFRIGGETGETNSNGKMHRIRNRCTCLLLRPHRGLNETNWAVKRFFKSKRIYTYQWRYPDRKILYWQLCILFFCISFVKMLLSWLFNVNVDAFFANLTLPWMNSWRVQAGMFKPGKHLKHKCPF